MNSLPLLEPLKRIIWDYCDTETQATLVEISQDAVKEEIQQLAHYKDKLYAGNIKWEEREKAIKDLANIIFKEKSSEESLIEALSTTRLTAELARDLARRQTLLLKALLNALPLTEEYNGQKNFLTMLITGINFPKEKFISYALGVRNPRILIEGVEFALNCFLSHVIGIEKKLIRELIFTDSQSFANYGSYESKLEDIEIVKVWAKEIYGKARDLRGLLEKDLIVKQKDYEENPNQFLDLAQALLLYLDYVKVRAFFSSELPRIDDGKATKKLMHRLTPNSEIRNKLFDLSFHSMHHLRIKDKDESKNAKDQKK